MSNEVIIRYESTYSGNLKSLKGESSDFDTYSKGEKHMAEMIDSHGHGVKVNIDSLRVEKSKDDEGSWTYIGELKDIRGEGRLLCSECGEVDAELNLVGDGSSDLIHGQCPKCGGMYEYWTAL